MGKKTALYEVHKKSGANIVDFGGWDMPVQYTSIIEEHLNTRKSAGLFDISHMGMFEISGEDALAFVQDIITNDVGSVQAGTAIYSPLCYENGTFVDDIIVYFENTTSLRLVVNASNVDKDFAWITKLSEGRNVEVENVSEDTGILAIQGPESAKILQELTVVDLASLEKFRFLSGFIGNIAVMISRTGYTGEDGFELYFEPEHAEHLWNRLFECGGKYGMLPVGLGARDTLRLEAGMRLYGNDIDDTTTPIEAGLGWSVAFEKLSFAGKDSLSGQIGNINRKLVGFEMLDKPIARHGYEVYKDGCKIGNVTSGTYSPSLNKPIGMAYVGLEHVKFGSEFEVLIRNKPFKARVVKMPFLSNQ